MEQIMSTSGIPLKVIYTPEDLQDWDYRNKVGNPGEYPFVRLNRGMTPAMCREMFGRGGAYAGFGTPESTNKWLKYLISLGSAQVSGGALDLPTQIGLDSDHPLALGEVGKQGVCLDSLLDSEIMFDGIPTEYMSFASVVSAIGPIYLAWAIALFEQRGVPLYAGRFSSQNDCLKEFIARGTQIFPPRPQVKFTCDVVEYCIRNGMKSASPMQVSGYHIREAGATAPQEMAFTLANAVAYFEELIKRGLSIDDFAPSIGSFFGTAGIDLFEETCKFRAYRRMWARVMKEKFHAKNPEAIKCACSSYTAGSYFTAQQPLNNIVRGTIGALVAALSGLPSTGMSCYDEALALPSEESIRVALRTRQIVADESGVFDTVDPLAGSYYIEALTDELEAQATEIFDKVQAMGGAIAALEQGFQQREIAKSAYERLKKVESGETVVVGVNKYVVDEPLPIEIRKVDTEEEHRQVEKLKKLRRERDNKKVDASLKVVQKAAEDGVNMVPSILDAVKTYATLGEICGILRSVWGEFKPTGL